MDLAEGAEFDCSRSQTILNCGGVRSGPLRLRGVPVRVQKDRTIEPFFDFCDDFKIAQRCAEGWNSGHARTCLGDDN